MPNLTTGIVPPKPGDKVKFVCPDCGKSFMHKKPLVPLPVKCPNCGKGGCREARKFVGSP